MEERGCTYSLGLIWVMKHMEPSRIPLGPQTNNSVGSHYPLWSMAVQCIITQSWVWNRPWPCSVHCWDKYGVRDLSSISRSVKGGPSLWTALSVFFPKHITAPLLSPLFSWNLLSGHFLSKHYCSYAAPLISSPANSHRRVNFCWPESLSQYRVSIVRCPLWSHCWLLECDKANRFHLALVFTLLCECVEWTCACTHRTRWQ